ncbi:FGGY carbohydrate kinase domain-containing protein isoform X2 [Helianthus annuus]|uniref:FGGY carbohydrate kinase domain-containing protein isoform X2 n=1 Tax=Helianthus annuus TaxID=4232 RepID=UPI000B8F9290|nr:FGGY carbohydrate kinase domain-containing protein isoform X2 [Helianthus annuus]
MFSPKSPNGGCRTIHQSCTLETLTNSLPQLMISGPSQSFRWDLLNGETQNLRCNDGTQNLRYLQFQTCFGITGNWLQKQVMREYRPGEVGLGRGVMGIKWKVEALKKPGLFDEAGKLLGSASSPIQIWKEGDCVEQSSTDTWLAICTAVKRALSLSDVAGEEVIGIGFAATCSLVAVDSEGQPVSVSWSGDTRRNVIVWMDHRAVKQAERINSFSSPVLQYCGGSISPEMQPPKLLWMKGNLQESWSMAWRWMDISSG